MMDIMNRVGEVREEERVQVEKYGNYDVRYVVKGNEKWTFASDFAIAVGYKSGRRGVHELVSRNEQTFGTNTYVHTLWTQGQRRQVRLFNNVGLATFLRLCGLDSEQIKELQLSFGLVSDKATANSVETKQSAIVQVSEIDVTDPNQLAQYMYLTNQVVQGLNKVVEEQKNQIREAAPKVNAYDKLHESDHDYSINAVSKLLNISLKSNKVMGQNQLFQYLRHKRIVYYSRGCNVPYQRYVDNGYFKLTMAGFDTAGNERYKTVALGKGVLYLHKILTQDGYILSPVEEVRRNLQAQQ